MLKILSKRLSELQGLITKCMARTWQQVQRASCYTGNPTKWNPVMSIDLFLSSAPGNVIDWAYAEAGISFSYSVFLRDTGAVCA